MTDLMELLYSYAEDYMVRGLLERGGDYYNVCYCADKQEQKLRELVGEENGKYLKDWLKERELIAHFEGQALFQAGFQMAMELSR